MNAGALLAAFLVLAAPLALGETLQSLAPTKPAPGKERRVALVIGNSAYKSSPLRNPVNDARAMARGLADAGFTSTLIEDATQAGMRRAIREFGDELARGGVGLFYYAGHGMQVRGRNFLIPVNADIAREDEVEDQAVDANLVLSKMDSAKNSLNLLVLDACRNNPFARSFRSAAQGLAQMDAPSGTLVAFATSPGSVAADGDGEHGLYTKHLLAAIRRPGLPVEQLFKQVRIEVTRETGDRQVPWESSSLKGDFYFVPEDRSAMQKAAIDKAVSSAVRREQEKATAERAGLEARMRELVARLREEQRVGLETELRARGDTTAAQASHRKADAALKPGAGAVAKSGAKPVARADAKVQVATIAPAAAAAGGRRAETPRPGDRWIYRSQFSNWDKPADQYYEVKAVIGESVLEDQPRYGLKEGRDEWVFDPGMYVLGNNNPGGFTLSPYFLAFEDLQVDRSFGRLKFQRAGECSKNPQWICVWEAKVAAKEKVTVPAGTFEAYRVEVQQTVRGSYREATFWYAPEVKRHVKVVIRTRGGTWTGADFKADLVSYKLK